LKVLGDPQTEYATVHIGGTNGKGSVAVLTYEALREAGFSVGLYTSPHLVDVRERMVVNERPISREAFSAWTARLAPEIERAAASFFEATTAIAFADFAARGVDVAVIEVGLGGRLDCTNVITPLASGVTNIALEHTEYLGESLEAIAREKAGIAKEGRPFVIGEPDPAVAQVLEATGREAGAQTIVVPPYARYEAPLGLAGAHQRRNAAVAAALLEALPERWRPNRVAVERAFARARLSGRLDSRGRWVFDVAHNRAGAEVLVRALRAASLVRPVHALVGILKDKEWRGMLADLSAVCDQMWLVVPPSVSPERRWDLPMVRRAMEGERRPLHFQPDFDRALGEVQIGAGTMLVTGSFHTVGDALGRLPGFAPIG
jgi:dihydrofolate synthase/folylpolyglutamate synthase